MSSYTAIEKWYNLVMLIVDDDDPFRRFPLNLPLLEKISQTTSTSTYTSRRISNDGMGVKMVADNLLKAAGTVVGATAVFYGGSPYLGMTSGAAAGSLLGDLMWRAIN